MDLEQMIKRLEWLDDERRKDKTIIATLEKRLLGIEGTVTSQAESLREMGSDITRVGTSITRFDQIDAAIAQIRVEFSRSMDAYEKQRVEAARESERVRREDLEQLNKAIADIRKGVEPLAEIKRNMQARVEEEYRLGRLIDELEHKIQDTHRADEEQRRSQRLQEETRRQDSKRLTDLQGEVSAMRKRLDEQRGKLDLAADNVHKVEMRIGDLIATEVERRQAQTSFIEKQNMLLFEREKTWKEWQAKFEEISKQSVNLDAQLQAIDLTNRSVKRSQEAFDEITQRFERRVNEITEMQRLVEERFRQEWVTFKADDQKRWTNYTLAYDEQNRDQLRRIEKLNDRMGSLEDITQDLRDTLEQANEETQKRLQSLLALIHQWVDAFERTVGQGH
ncbi:MAG: hypothetical protein GYA17_05120 [Chloroflexi bacterium]|jgi:chromosome segregation ATPase|nr:hypothetical protein [Anaerolineaceae bacterium]NMB87716.1 hypothetical protein [Chloroflexota bacterium]